MSKSLKTTISGVAALLAAVGIAVVALVDGDPGTKPDLNAVLIALTALGVGIPTWLVGFFARDKDVSSEEEGIK